DRQPFRRRRAPRARDARRRRRLRQQARLHPRRHAGPGAPCQRYKTGRAAVRRGRAGMSESRILLLNRDVARAEKVAALLEFMDFTPRIVDEVGDIDLKRARASDWVAIVVGDVGDDPQWPAFVEWLATQALHPPLLTLPGHAGDAPWRASVHPDAVWPLAWPIRH